MDASHDLHDSRHPRSPDDPDNPTDPPDPTTAIDRLLDFWFGPPGSAKHDTLRPIWFRRDDAFDARCKARFGARVEQALRGELDGWAAAPRGALARVLLLDQFTRNIFRGTPRAFAGDAQAIAAARAMVGSRQDLALPAVQRAFVYMPYEHAEGIETQHEAVRLFRQLEAADGRFADMRDYAERHRDVIERFGRFPHRNEILGRRSTAEEAEFLAEPGSRF